MRFRGGLTALCVLAVLGLVRPAQAQIELFQLSTVDDVPTRIDVGYDSGDGLGFDSGFIRANFFLPFYQSDDVVLFTDSRFINFNQSDQHTYTTGLGARVFSANLDRVVGVNVLYDNFDSGRFTYNQLGLGWELLGDYIDVRGNFYIPLGDNRHVVSQTISSSMYQGNNIVQSILQFLEVSQRGTDVEVGVRLPTPRRVEAHAYAGYYNYQGQGSTQINGFRGRLEASVLDFATVDVVVQNDRVFDWTSYAGVGIRFGGPSTREGNVPLRDRRAVPIERAPNVIVRNTTQSGGSSVAIDPATGQPIRVVHVNSNVAAGGNGTFENPFNTLAAAQTGSIPRDIIFAHAGSAFTPATNFALQPNQMFLGEGIPHVVATTQGPLTLPPATGLLGTPSINLAAGGAGVVLSQNNTISGLDFRGAGAGVGIRGQGPIGTASINRNSFAGFSGIASAGVNLQDAGGIALLVNNTGMGNTQDFSLLANNTPLRLNAALRGNTHSGGGTIATIQTVGGMLGVQVLNNRGGSPITITNTAGTLFVEQTLTTNVPVPTTSGTITFLPFGGLGLP